MPSREQTRQEYMPKWDELFLDQGQGLSGLPDRPQLGDLASIGGREEDEIAVLEPSRAGLQARGAIRFHPRFLKIVEQFFSPHR